MCKLIRRLICIGIIAILVFIALSVMSGGEKFRWFGRTVGQQSEKIGDEADKLKEKTEKIKTGIDDTKEKIRDLKGKKGEKSN